MSHFYTRGVCAVAVFALLTLSGCAQIPLGNPSPNFDNIAKARSLNIAPISVGKFQADPKADPGMDKGLSVRSNNVTSPVEGSFAQYLRQTLITDLQAGGLYDEKAPAVLSGTLTESALEVPIGAAHTSLGANFVLTRDSKAVYQKNLKASVNWEAPFLGAVAIPEGINRYTALHHELVKKLLDDPDFQRANAK